MPCRTARSTGPVCSPRRSRAGVCPGTSPSSWTATAGGRTARAHPHRRAPGGGGGAPRRRRGSDPGRGEAPLGLRLLDRELVALTRRGALPDGLQPRRAAPPARPAQRVGRAHPLGGAQAAPVGVGDPRAAVRRAAHGVQQRADPHDVRQLRRSRRARRRGALDRRRRGGGADPPERGQREADPAPALHPGDARRRPVRALER